MARRKAAVAAASLVPPATAAIRAEAGRVGWPIQFPGDLNHDTNAIATMLPREPFAWCLRPDGTHIARVASEVTMRMVAEAFDVRVCRFYVWNGQVLEPHPSPAVADQRLDELGNVRFRVKTRRASSLVPASCATASEATEVASRWEHRYGEDFVVFDTWEQS